MFAHDMCSAQDRREAAAAVVDESLRRQIGALTRSLEGTVRERDGLALRLAQLELQARGLADDLRAARRNERRHNSERTLLEQWYLTLQEEFRAFVQSGHAPPQPPPPAAPPAAASVAAAASAAAATPAATPVAAGGDQTQVASEVRPDEPALAVATTAKQPDPEPLPQFTSATSTTDLPQQERSPPAPQQLLSSATSTTDLPQQQSSQPVSSATPTAPVPQPPQVPPPRRASEMKDVLTRLKLREDNIRFRELLRLFTESFTETGGEHARASLRRRPTACARRHAVRRGARTAHSRRRGPGAGVGDARLREDGRRHGTRTAGRRVRAATEFVRAQTVAVAVGTLRPAKAQTEAADLRLVQLREQLKERLGLLRSTTEDIDKRSAPMLTAPTPPAAERPAKVGVRRHTVATKVELAEVVHARVRAFAPRAMPRARPASTLPPPQENVLRETAEAELRHVRARLVRLRALGARAAHAPRALPQAQCPRGGDAAAPPAAPSAQPRERG